MPGLQVLRFIAALGVFVYHLVIYAQRAGVLPLGVAPYSAYGGVGVCVFFVLSGFLMAMLSERTTPLRFLARRALRIYPGFWLAVGVAALLELVVLGNVDSGFQWPAVLSLFPAGNIRYPLNVEWTLVFEVLFYTIVSVLCLVPVAVRQVALLAWFVAIASNGEPLQAGHIWDLPLSQHNAPFIVGMFTWWLRNHLRFVKGPVSVAVGVALLIVVRENSASIGWFTYYVFAAFAAGIWVLAGSRAVLFSDHGLFKRLGDASYGIYLLHAPLLFMSFSVTTAPAHISLLVVAIGTFLLATLFGTLEHQLHVTLQHSAGLRTGRKGPVPSAS